MPGPDLALLLEAAQAAGEVALGYWRRDPRSWDKGAEGPVSEADHAVDRLLAGKLRAARPDYGWLSEETPDDGSHGTAARSFVVDPIDGTRAFLAGQPGFAVAAAVVEDGRPVAGVVHLPALRLTYTAEAGGPALCNGAAIRVSGCSDPDGARALASSGSMAADAWPGGPPRLSRAFRPALAWRLCLVAEGTFDVVLTLRDAWVWDLAAGALIAERAGATVSDPDGGALDFRRRRLPGLIAAPPGLHAALLARRRPDRG